MQQRRSIYIHLCLYDFWIWGKWQHFGNTWPLPKGKGLQHESCKPLLLQKIKWWAILDLNQ